MRPSAGETARWTWGTILAVIALFVIIIALAIMWVFGIAFFSKTTAETRGQTEVREETVADGDFRIMSYNHFFNVCTAVQKNEERIKALKEERDLESTADARKAQINSNLAALRATRDGLIHQYNNDAQREGTIGPFRANNLPEKLDTEEEKTECIVESQD